MSITGFNRRRREIAALEEAKQNKEATIILDSSEANENIDYSKLKVEELKVIAKEKGIDGFDNMKKAGLIESIEELG